MVLPRDRDFKINKIPLNQRLIGLGLNDNMLGRNPVTFLLSSCGGFLVITLWLMKPLILSGLCLVVLAHWL